MSTHSLSNLQQSIVSCQLCNRLRTHCQTIAKIKRKSYQNETYWGKPVPGFGDPLAKLMIVGLAPGAHGANRTGRVFTGDRSGEWLYRALHKAGFANQLHSTSVRDGLKLNSAYITCVVKCAPPDNKPSPEEIKTCQVFLKKELEQFKDIRVWIALGQVALRGIWALIQPNSPLPKFQHGAKIEICSNQWLLLSYHPSQQNTFTGKLTEQMFYQVFSEAKTLLSS